MGHDVGDTLTSVQDLSSWDRTGYSFRMSKGLKEKTWKKKIVLMLELITGAAYMIIRVYTM